LSAYIYCNTEQVRTNGYLQSDRPRRKEERAESQNFFSQSCYQSSYLLQQREGVAEGAEASSDCYTEEASCAALKGSYVQQSSIDT
jgi:hypothetical protein